MVLMVAAYELILWTPFDDDELKLPGLTTIGIYWHGTTLDKF